VIYQDVGREYFEKRGLRRYARVWSLWALGVGAVISGHYSGWNFGLAHGFGGMLIALVIIAAMYWGLIYSLAEMSPALPHTGAAYSFARSAMGPWGGMVTGLAESIEYILTPAVIVFFIGSYMTAIFETPDAMQPLWWAGSYAVFLFLNLRGVELSFKVSVIVTLGALAILAIYWVSAIPHFDVDRWALNIGVGADGSAAVIDWTSFAVTDSRFDLAWTLVLAYAYSGQTLRDQIFSGYQHHAGKQVEQIEAFEAIVCARRLLDLTISLTQGAQRMGMNAQAVEAMRANMEAHRRVHRLLIERTGLQIEIFTSLFGNSG